MSYPVGKRTKVKGQAGLYIYAGKGRVDGRQPLCYYFTYRKSGYIKVGWNYEGFDLEDAKARREAYIHALRTGKARLDPAKFETTFRAAFKEFMAYSEATNSSARSKDHYAFKHYLNPTFGRKPLNTITKSDVDRFLGMIERKGLSSNYRQSIFSTLRRAFGFLINEGYCKADPTRGLAVKGERQIKERYLELYEIQAMLEYCDEKIAANTSERYKLAWTEARAQILLGVEMGLRRSEMRDTPSFITQKGVDYSLTWERINWETGMIRIVGKGKRSRTLPMTPRVRAALKTLGPRGRGRVFVAQRYEEIRQTFADLGFNAGLDYNNPDDRRNWCSMHTLRHTFGSYAAMRLKDPHIVAQLMGHSVITTTEIYSHLIKGETEKAMANIGNFFAESGEQGGNVIPFKRGK
ncbi:MAG: tyrosine-type recombinase/integrase [Vulcanimicrobiota bacterium]